MRAKITKEMALIRTDTEFAFVKLSRACFDSAI